jgi:TIR domain
MSASADPRVFISYRREETAGHAGRLYDALVAHFGDDNVFMDVEMAPGIDFVERISFAVGACRALVVVIGRCWAQPTEGRASARIADPDDFVRLEVEMALRSPDVTVIPVLVGGARMPDPAELPESLRPLTRRNALELSDLRWRYDVGRLIDALDELLGAGPPARPAGDDEPARGRPAAPVTPRPSRTAALLPLFAEGVGLAVVAGLLGHVLADAVTTQIVDDSVQTIVRRAITWAIVAGVLGGWLTVRRGEHRRVTGRVLAGLALGALAGALGGVVFELPNLIHGVTHHVTGPDRHRLEVASLAVTGGLLGLAVGALWIPPRAFVGLLCGVVGGVLIQALLNQGAKPPNQLVEVGLQCLVIFGFTLAAMLALDVRAAEAVAPAPLPVPQPAGDR